MAERGITGSARGLSVAQRSRRDRMLAVAIELATEGGYDAVSMREVAERADAALATVYRHFPSKDHLLLGVMAGAMDRLHGRMRQSRPRGTTAAERVTEVLERSTRSLLRTPSLSAAILRAWVTISGDAGGNAERIASTTRQTLQWAIGADHLPTEHDLLVMKILNRVWFGELLFWANGRESDEELLNTIRVAVAALYPD
ncbi:TetR family transcriptional regulator [Nakamurella lactea]|jgi:AcrR family transcriptional regulator|uniref:TetR family transcriptional regulator n=1 Tax=Nakamurella lactea TaxID=459515 RepID=UPI0003FA839D|nr:TetR family transcriptional regulator [Nakamurella lactea]